MTAENRRRAARRDGGTKCFNEAAADDRGKPWTEFRDIVPLSSLQ